MEELAAPAADINLIAQLHLVGILGALLMLGITWTAVHLITRTVTGLGDRFVDKRLLLNQIATIARFVVWTLGVFLAIRALDLSREIVIAFTGALGLMIGFVLDESRIAENADFRASGRTPAAHVVTKLMEAGLIAVPAGQRVVRWLPALNVSDDEVGEALAIQRRVLDALAG